MNEEENRKLIDPVLKAWTAIRQNRLKITKTTTTPAGQVLDWVPIESQTSAKIASPPPAVLPGFPADPERLAESVRFDIGEIGPAGHVPILRQDLTRINRMEEFRHRNLKQGGLVVNRKRPRAVPEDPLPVGYNHASSSQWITVQGCETWLNIWDPKINFSNSTSLDHSISQLWLLNYEVVQNGQSVEAGWNVDHGLYNDFYPHLFTYFTTDGYAGSGNNIGGYNRTEQGWVQYHPSIFPGIGLYQVSAQGGKQTEIGLKVQLFEGNWWLGIGYGISTPWTWIGYYPAGLFKGGLENQANWVGFGGEVYSGLADPTATLDQMGSGVAAPAGWTHAAYQRNLAIQTDSKGTMAHFDGEPGLDPAVPGGPVTKYTLNCAMNSGSSWGSFFYYGGPV